MELPTISGVSLKLDFQILTATQSNKMQIKSCGNPF